MKTTPVTVLSEERCWELLEAHQVGRLALSVGGEVDIYPVNFCVHDKNIYFRTGSGQKLTEVVISRKAAFEIDEVIDGVARSVVIHGQANWLTSEADIEAVEALGFKTWVPTYKTSWVQVIPERISGREFELGEDPVDEL